MRFFHDLNISPSGWIKFKRKIRYVSGTGNKKTECDFQATVSCKDIMPCDKVSNIPLKIMSYDIEASSSHGDFPLAKKTYSKLAGDIITYWSLNKDSIKEMTDSEQCELFSDIIFHAFNLNPSKYKDREDFDCINRVYPKQKYKTTGKTKKVEIQKVIKYILDNDLCDIVFKTHANKERYYDNWVELSESCKNNNILYLLNYKMDSGIKMNVLDMVLFYEPSKKDSFQSSKKNNRIKNSFPELEGDKCTFIGSTFRRMGENEPYKNNIIVLGDSSQLPNIETVCCKNERQLLLKWKDLIKEEKPDIIIGYNIFGFDWKFVIERAEELDCKKEFLKMSKNKGETCMVKKSSVTVASGTHELQYVNIPGRVQLDLYNHYRKEVNLPSYKLDYVSSHFIGDMVNNVEECGNDADNEQAKYTKIYSKNLKGLKKGHYICFEIINYSSDMYDNGKKFMIEKLNTDEGYFIIKAKLNLPKGKIRWCLAKDDVTPQDIFRLSNQGPMEKSIVAKYCIQDCNLVQNLMLKGDMMAGIMAQSEVCNVPIDYIIMRGQGIKLLSFIAKKCALVDTLMPVLHRPKGAGGYEGAICLTAKRGYHDRPVGVVDYSSLYPSSMVSENISHDSKVWTKEYDLDDNLIKVVGEKNEKGEFKYDNLPGYKYVDIEYDTYKYIRKHEKAAAKKVKVGRKVCRFAQFPDGKRAIMPSVLVELLAARKKTRGFIKFKTVTTKSGDAYSGFLSEKDDKYVVVDENKKTTEIDKAEVESVEDTYDDFMKNVFNNRQLAFKIVANSLYGQTGGKTSSFYEIDVAASTTATGRKLLKYACKIVDEAYGDRIVDTSHGKVHCHAETVYGDTDSAFMCFNLTDLEGNDIRGKKELELTIELSIQLGETASMFLKAPHDLEYEKTFYPFLLLSKKRYVGMLYETNINKCKCKFMGIVLKRRDNAPIVKDIYGGNIDILMKSGNIEEAMEYTKNFLNDMVDEKFPLDKLIITKSLRGFYKNPQTIAHKVLADRMGKRDAGTKPSVGSRVPFVYIQTKGKVKLQGDKIEHPDYIKKNNLKPDYGFYITNQIKKPLMQIYSLMLEQMPSFKRKKELQRKIRTLSRKLKSELKNDNLTIEERAELVRKYDDKEMKIRNDYVNDLIFKSSVGMAKNMKNNQFTLDKFFKKN